MNFLLNLLNLLIVLPLWGKIAVLGGLVVLVVGSAWWIKYQFNKIVHEGVMNAGAALANARVEVHSMRAVPPPVGPSPYDAKPGDEDFMEGVDDEGWAEPGVNFYELDATITPVEPTASWSPSGLSIVPADWVPEEPTDLCERMGGVHTAQLFQNGRWHQADDDDVTGPQRVKLLFGFQFQGDRAICLRNFVTPVGDAIKLPAAVTTQLRTG